MGFPFSPQATKDWPQSLWDSEGLCNVHSLHKEVLCKECIWFDLRADCQQACCISNAMHYCFQELRRCLQKVMYHSHSA